MRGQIPKLGFDSDTKKSRVNLSIVLFLTLFVWVLFKFNSKSIKILKILDLGGESYGNRSQSNIGRL